MLIFLLALFSRKRILKQSALTGLNRTQMAGLNRTESRLKCRLVASGGKFKRPDGLLFVLPQSMTDYQKLPEKCRLMKIKGWVTVYIRRKF
jgi:hypothetical protein